MHIDITDILDSTIKSTMLHIKGVICNIWHVLNMLCMVQLLYIIWQRLQHGMMHGVLHNLVFLVMKQVKIVYCMSYNHV